MPEVDEITLTLPREREFRRVAHLVLGGVALRHELTIEALEDLQVAVGAVLDHSEADGEVTVAVSVHGDVLETRIGPVDLRTELEDEDGDGLSLRRVLGAVVDDVEADGEWIRLTKRVAR